MKDRIGYRLSPNEEARLMKEARETLRKQRLLQVRERAKLNAAKIRQSVKEEKQKQLQKLAKEIEDEWNREKEEKLRTLKDIYEHNLKHVGEAHRNALQEESKEDNRALTAEVDSRRAQIRHKNALQRLHQEVAKQQEEANRHIIARQTALELEKARAAEIASRPPPPPDPVVKIEVPKVRPVKFTDLTAFSATHYHIPEVCYVEKAEPNQQEINALQLAESESEKLAEVEKEQKRSLHEQREKARLRHKHALKKELLKQDYATMLHDLSDLQRADMHRRQLVVAKIPKQIFIPPHRRLEEKEDTQREMEGAFENMYMKATEYFGDLSLALDPHPPPETPSVTESLDLSVQDLDTTITGDQDLADPSTGPPVLTDLTNGDGYQRLLSRIKAQRQLAQKGSVITDPDLTGGSKISAPGYKQHNKEEHRKTPEGLRRLVKRIKAQRELSQKSSSGSDRVHTTEDIRDRPSPASQATSLSQHVITDTSPSSATETESLSTGILSSNGSSSLTQGTLTTQSSMSTVSTTTQETDQSEMSTVSASETLSEQETIGSCESSTSTVIDVGKMTNGEKNQLLLHPLEQAAQVRQKVSQYLQDQRERHDNIERKKLMDAIGQETIQSQHELEEQRKLLEEKLQNIEKQRLLVVSRMSELSTRGPDTTLNSQSASFHPLGGGTFQHQSSSSSSSSWRTAGSHPLQGSTALSGSHSAIPQHSFQNGILPLGSGGYSVADLPPQTVSLEQRDSRLQQFQDYQQELGKKLGKPFNEMMTSRQQMADRAQQLLQVNNGIAKDELSPESQPSQFDHLADSSFTQEPMTGSSQHSSERHSVESGLPSSSSVHISGVSELHSTFPRVSDLEERFGVLEDRLRRAGVALAPSGRVDAAMPTVPSGEAESFIQTNGRDQNDSFEKRRNELEAELDKIEKQKASILKQDQLQKEKIQLLKSTWFTMPPDSDESAKQMTSDRFDEPTAEQGKSSGPQSPRRHLSFADSIPDEPSGHPALTWKDFHELDPQRAELETSVHHGDVSEKKQLLYHPHEFSYGSTAQGHSSSGVYNEFSWPILQRTGQDPKRDNMSKSGRTWHMELMECSTSSENGSQKSLLKKLPTPPDTDKEPLVFEVEGLHSPLVLRYQAGQEASPSDDNQQLASTPIRRTEADARKEFKSPRSCLSLYTPGSDPQQKLSGGAMSVRFVEQSHHPQEVSLDEGNLKQRHSEMSEYPISEESHRLSQPWQQLTTELSQFSLSARSDSTTRESDHPVSIDEFRPLAALSGSSQLEEVADGDSSKWEQNTQLLRSNQEHVSEMADDISRRIEESLAQHRQLVEQTRRIMDEHNADTEHQSGTDQFAALEEEQHLTFGNLKEQTGILDEPDITLVSLDSTSAQETEDNRVINNSSPFTSVSMTTTPGSAPADSTSLTSTSCPLTTTPTSTTQSSGYMNLMFRDPTTGSQVQESLGQSDGDVESEIIRESDASVPNAPASDLCGTTSHQHGIGARPKQVKFEITNETSESGRCKTVEQQCDDTTDSSHQESDFISINIQHIDGSSTDEYEGLSLREAFMKKKRDFIEASEKRKKKAEEKAKRSTAKCQQQQQQQQRSSLGKTLASWKKSRKLNNQPATKRRDPTTIVERTSEQRKKDEREMKARTSRLYGRLEEVKQRKLEEERKRQYAENREKAKAFYQKLEKHKKS